MTQGMRWLRRILISLGLTLLFTALLLAALPALLQPALNRWLPAWLGSDTRPAIVQIDALSWHHLHLSQLQLTLPDDTVMAVRDLNLHYRPGELLRGFLREVSVHELTLQLPAPSAARVASAAASNAGAAAREHFNQPVRIPAFSQWLQLPVGQIQLHRINLLHPALALQLQASITPQLWRVHGSLQGDNLPLPWQLELQMQSSGQWLLLVSEHSQLLLQQYGLVTQDEQHTHIQLEQRLDLAALSERLPALAGLPLPLQQLQAEADIHLPNAGILPQDMVLGSALTLSTRAAPLPGGMHWQQGEWLLTLTKEQPTSDWRLHLLGSPQRLQLPASLSGTQALTLHSQQQLSGHCDARLQECQLHGELINQALGTGQQTLASLNVSPTLHWQASTGLQLQLPLQAQAFPQQLPGAAPVQDLHSSGTLQASLTNDGQWQLRSDHGLQTRLQLPPHNGWTLPGLTLDVLPGLHLAGQLSATAPTLQADPLRLVLHPVTLHQAASAHTPASSLQLQRSQLECRPFLRQQRLNSSCQITLHTDRSTLQGWPLPDLHLSGPLLLRQQNDATQLSAQLHLHGANDQLQMRLNLQHHADQQRGSLQWHLNDLPLHWNTLGLPELAALTRTDWLSGSLSGQGWADWQRDAAGHWQLTPDISLRADNLSGIYDGSMAIDGWNALLALRRPFQGDYLLDAQLSGASLNPGVALTNLLARSQTRIAPDFSWAEASIYEVRTDLLGGSIRTPLIHYDTRKRVNAFGIELNRIQLAQIAALEPSSEVQATGILDGLLPIVLTPDGPQVPAGNLFARDPGGVIRYQNATSEALSSSDQSVGMAMRLLQNFHYNQLQTGVTYQPDGQFNLALQFQGKNPDFFGGQATHLNVNLEYNLLDLLESLRVTQDVISTLEDKYR